ncbi:MAG: bactofilin family protein [Flavobacteriales bacterium]
MFSDKKNKKTQEPSTGQNRINEGTQIQGDINSTGFFRIDGQIKGTVKTPSKVVIGKSGSIIGNLICSEADIEGFFEGNLDIEKTLTLRSTAKITGEVVIGKLAVEPGATFNATCLMKGSKEKKLAS